MMHPIAASLRSDETLLWSGQPEKVGFRKEDLPILLAALGLFLFSISLLKQSPQHAPAFASIDWYVTFWLIPSLISVGSLFVLLKVSVLNHILRSRYYYVITSERVMVISDLFWQNVRSLSIRELGSIEIQDHHALGHMTFYRKSALPVQNGINFRYSKLGPISFWEVKNIGEAYRIIQGLKQQPYVMKVAGQYNPAAL